jgi:CubicO group peptidase (beta-lactamase class C family)
MSTQEAFQNQLNLAVEAGLPGVSAAVGSQGRIIWQGQAGFSDVTKEAAVSPEHIFGVGSITKVFASVVTLQLHEEKRISFDAKVGDYLDSAVLKDIPNASTATIASLLSHTSGILPGRKIQHGSVSDGEKTLILLEIGERPIRWISSGIHGCPENIHTRTPIPLY